MRKVTLRFQYWFDNVMSKGTTALLLWLFFATILMLITIGLLAKLTPEGREIPFIQLIWMGLMRTLDAGTMGGDEGSYAFPFLMLAVTIGGIFMVGTLIGILTTGFDQKLSELRKGRSIVLEENHTVILGWSSQIFYILSEIITANENKKRACIVILADKDKVEMEDEISERIADRKTTQIVCRRGNPLDPNDLSITNLDSSRSIIILPPDQKQPDTFVIKTLLAIVHNPSRTAEYYHIVSTIHDEQNLDITKLIGKDEVTIVLADDLISRITAQTCRQSGLSVVYTELLDFSGDEIYLKSEPQFSGKSFGEVQMHYLDSTLIGICRSYGSITLAPPADTIIQASDQLIFIAKDDDAIIASVDPYIEIEESLIVHPPHLDIRPERTLILGWNERAPFLIEELDRYVAPGSLITVMSKISLETVQQACRFLHLQNQSIQFIQADTTKRNELDAVKVPDYDHVILLSYSDLEDIQEADAQTLITLLHLREIANQCEDAFSIVSEMLDSRNRELAEVAKADDFIVSQKLISLMLSQLSENQKLASVFQDLFDPQGVEIYLKPIDHYLHLTKPVSFYTLTEAAKRRNEVAIGYRIAAQANDPTAHYGVYLNPTKNQLIQFTHQDKIIVLAENEA